MTDTTATAVINDEIPTDSTSSAPEVERSDENVDTAPVADVNSQDSIANVNEPHESTAQHRSDNPAAPDSDATDDLAKLLQNLELAQEKLRNASEENDEQRAIKMLTLASSQCEYLTAAKAKDEGAYVEAPDLAARAEGIFSRSTLLYGSSKFTQMIICYNLYQQTNKVEWLQQGIDIGTESANLLDVWPQSLQPDFFRQHYSKRCDQVSLGYQWLCAVKDDKQTFYNAVIWQGKAAAATARTDGMELGCEEWEIKYERDNLWAQLWQNYMDKNTQITLEVPINHLKTVYNQTLTGNATERRCYFRILYLECLHWIVTRDADTLNSLIDRGSQIIIWNKESKIYEFLLKDRWVTDPTNRQHGLKAAIRMFHQYSQLFIPDSDGYNEVAYMNVAIALWIELREGHRFDMLADLEERDEPLLELQGLYRRRYELTKEVSCGWDYDELQFEACMIRLVSEMLRWYNTPPDVPIQPVLRSFSICTFGVSIVTKQAFVAYMFNGDIQFGWDSAYMKFKRDLASLRAPLVAADWITGRGEDGLWIMGEAIEGEYEHLPNFTGSKCSDVGRTKHEAIIEEIRENMVSRQANGLPPIVVGFGIQP